MRLFGITCCVVVAASVVGLSVSRAQMGGGGEHQGGPDMGAVLMKGLKATKGCLGVDSGQMSSGKLSIFAWFEDKEAAKRWYYSEAHQGFVHMAGGAREGKMPLEHAPADTPILVIASITMADKPEIAGLPMPISQISIELFQPIAGGAEFNGRLSPEAFKVDHLTDYTADGLDSGG